MTTLSWEELQDEECSTFALHRRASSEADFVEDKNSKRPESFSVPDHELPI